MAKRNGNPRASPSSDTRVFFWVDGPDLDGSRLTETMYSKRDDKSCGNLVATQTMQMSASLSRIVSEKVNHGVQMSHTVQIQHIPQMSAPLSRVLSEKVLL